MSFGARGRRRVDAGALCLALSAGGLGCTEQVHALAGPAVAYPAGKPSYGAAATFGKGSGASIHGSEKFHTFGLAGRVLITEEIQHLRGGFALQLGEWSGPRKVLFEGTVPLALGVERFERRLDASVGSGLALRLGYPLTERSTALSPFFYANHAVTNEQKRHRRERTVLFAGPSADIDFRFGQQPLPTLSLLIGVLWLSEDLPAEQPIPPRLRNPFGGP